MCAWYTNNGERLGTYSGHQGAIWTVDVSPNSRIVATGAADNAIKLWNTQTGECIKTWEQPTAIKRVEFSEDGKMLLAVTEKRMGHLGTICVYDIRYGDDLTDQADDLSLKITCEESKATVAAWSFLDKYIIAGHEDGSVSQYDAKVQETPLISGMVLLTLALQLGELNFNEQIHEYDMQINDLQMAPDRTYFITAGKDKTAKVCLRATSISRPKRLTFCRLYLLATSQSSRPT